MELKKTEQQAHSIVALTVEITQAELNQAKDKAYRKIGKNMILPGFRKGKAPRRMIERFYGEDVFFEDAINDMSQDVLNLALEKSELEPVGRADISLGDKSEEGGISLIVKVPVEPAVELGEYKGIAVKKRTPEVTEEDIQAELQKMARENARTETVDRAAQTGDTVCIDFEGFKDGVAFEGGKGTDVRLELGSGRFIPGFEEQLTGTAAGDEKDVVVTFPEDYGEKSLAGQEAVFKCKVHSVEEVILPETDDEFAKDVSDTCETLEDLKKEISDRILKDRLEISDRDLEDALLDRLLKDLKTDIPEAMVESQIDKNIQEMAYQVQLHGMTLEQYLNQCNINLQTLRYSMHDRSVREVRTRLALKNIAELENIGVSEEEIEEEYTKMSEQSGLELEKVKERVPREPLTENLRLFNALEFVKQNANIEYVSWLSEDADKKQADGEKQA